jgi:serine O-acetyltransferase
VQALLHPALPALWSHRVAHNLDRRGHRFCARLLAYAARLASGGTEIHPSARLGRRVFIDHGAAVVIGETAVIGDDVTIFHQVTLGAVGWWRDQQREPGTRRHPVVGDRVVLGANAIVLGPVTVGHDALIGAGALVLTDVPPGSRVTAPAAKITPGLSAEDREESARLLRSLATHGCW